MAHWGMVIDLRKCIGCKACTIVCKRTNKVPTDCWRWIVDCGLSEPPERQRTFLPMSCMHCDEPPCMAVCPTGATYQRHDGVVDVYHELCVGCGYCIVACPYRARSIVFHQKPGVADHDLDHTEHLGVATKCNFCLPLVDAGLTQGLQPGLDPDATPACVLSCSANALHFGDLDDPDSEVSRLIRENKTARLQEELETEPSVYYIVE
ncbi:MAG: 4Fe-4S dicluster domain-containing protein [Chloroflexota bacterium]|nr:4Fe-4S dicluster domain-containing protein [Chloroflexota bacterium]